MTPAQARKRPPVLTVVGAGGLVGSLVVSLLTLRAFNWGEVRLLASPRSAGRSLPVRGRRQPILPVEDGCFEGSDVVVFAAPAEVSLAWAPHALNAGAVVVDGSGAHVDNPEVPVIVPAVNGTAAADPGHRLVAVPGGMATTLSEALSLLHQQWELHKVVVSTFEPASLFGTQGVARLWEELQAAVEVHQSQFPLGQRPGDVRTAIGTQLGDASPFPAPLALNVIPFLGDLAADGTSSDERLLAEELRRVLGLPKLQISATRSLVPVTTGHCASVHVVCQRRVRLREARELFVEAPELVVVDDAAADDLPTPIDVAGSDPAFVTRLRQDREHRHELDMVLVSDNVRRGTALALLKVAELLALRESELSS